MTSQQGLSYLGVGGMVEGCDRSPSEMPTSASRPRVLGVGALLQGSRRHVAEERNPPLRRVSRMRLPTKRFTRPAVTISIQLLHTTGG